MAKPRRFLIEYKVRTSDPEKQAAMLDTYHKYTFSKYRDEVPVRKQIAKELQPDETLVHAWVTDWRNLKCDQTLIIDGGNAPKVPGCLYLQLVRDEYFSSEERKPGHLRQREPKGETKVLRLTHDPRPTADLYVPFPKPQVA